MASRNSARSPAPTGRIFLEDVAGQIHGFELTGSALGETFHRGGMIDAAFDRDKARRVASCDEPDGLPRDPHPHFHFGADRRPFDVSAECVGEKIVPRRPRDSG